MADTNVKIYLFADRNGNEWMSNERPERGFEYISAHAPEEKSRFWRGRATALLDYLESEHETGWFTSIGSCDYGTYVPGEELYFDAIELPPGTIKLILGYSKIFGSMPEEVDAAFIAKRLKYLNCSE